MVDISKQKRLERSISQMTLGRFISELENLPNKEIDNYYSPHSYRGYYSDLAFKKGIGTRTVKSLLEQMKNECLNKKFKGYKGGDFYMDENTPIWIAEYGQCGEKVINIQVNETITLITEW